MKKLISLLGLASVLTISSCSHEVATMPKKSYKINSKNLPFVKAEWLSNYAFDFTRGYYVMGYSIGNKERVFFLSPIQKQQGDELFCPTIFIKSKDDSPLNKDETYEIVYDVKPESCSIYKASEEEKESNIIIPEKSTKLM